MLLLVSKVDAFYLKWKSLTELRARISFSAKGLQFFDGHVTVIRHFKKIRTHNGHNSTHFFRNALKKITFTYTIVCLCHNHI